MATLLWFSVFQACLLSATLAYFLTWVARFVAPRIGLCDRPDGKRKRHVKSTPLMGGMAIYLALLAVAGGCWLFGHELLHQGQQSGVTWLALLASAGLTCLVGLWDDKFNMQAGQKTFCQILACIPFVFWGPAVESISLMGFELHLGAGGVVFTFVWLFSCSTVVNLADGMDGLAGTIGVIATVALAVLSATMGQYAVMLVSMVVAGSLVGFLIHNWPPAKIFMGDAGSLTVGFLVGALSILSSAKQATGFTLIAPLVLISLPICDTTMAIVRRTLTGNGICTGDHAHIHHRLQERGLTRLQALMALSGICFTMAIVAIVSARLESDVLGAAVCLLILAVLIASGVLGRYEASLLIQRFRIAGIVIADGFRALPLGLATARLSGLDADQWRECWDKSRLRAAESGAHGLEFTCSDVGNGRTLLKLCWGEPDVHTSHDNGWLFRYSIQRDDGVQATMTVMGDSSAARPPRRFDDLVTLSHSLCRDWPIENSGIGLSTDGRVRPIRSQQLPDALPTPNGAGNQNRRAA